MVLVDSKVGDEIVLEPIQKKYRQLMEMMDARRDDDRMASIRERVMGVDVVRQASQAFWLWKARQQLRISPGEWKRMTFDEKGEAVAFVQLDNQVETYRRYMQELKRPTQQPSISTRNPARSSLPRKRK